MDYKSTGNTLNYYLNLMSMLRHVQILQRKRFWWVKPLHVHSRYTYCLNTEHSFSMLLLPWIDTDQTKAASDPVFPLKNIHIHKHKRIKRA